MRVVVTQIYIEPGIRFPFSFEMQRHVTSALSKVVTPSATFRKRYGDDYQVIVRLSADTGIATPVVKGPAHYKKTKDVEYSLFLPYDVIIREHDGCRAAMSFLMTGVRQILVGLGLETAAFDQRSGSLIDEVCADPSMIEGTWPSAPTR